MRNFLDCFQWYEKTFNTAFTKFLAILTILGNVVKTREEEEVKIFIQSPALILYNNFIEIALQ